MFFGNSMRAYQVLRVDDYPSVQSALDAAAKASAKASTALLFGSHEYRLKATSAAASSVLTVSNATGLRIDGCGASIVIMDPAKGFLKSTNSTRLTVRNLTIDYDPLPMTQGRVVAVQSPLQYSLKIDAGFPMLSAPYFFSSGSLRAERWAILKDRAKPTRHKEGSLNLLVVANWTSRGGQGLFDVRLCDPHDPPPEQNQ